MCEMGLEERQYRISRDRKIDRYATKVMFSYVTTGKGRVTSRGESLVIGRSSLGTMKALRSSEVELEHRVAGLWGRIELACSAVYGIHVCVAIP